MRRLTGGIKPVFALIEFCDHLTIPDSLREDVNVKNLEIMAINTVCWCNDLYSAPKEMLIGDYHNLVLLVHLEQKTTLEQAVNTVVNMHNQELRNMINLEKHILSLENNSNVELAKYISGIHAWIGSHYHWYSHSGRYLTHS